MPKKKKKVMKVIHKPIDSKSKVEMDGDFKVTPLKDGGNDFHVTKDGANVTVTRGTEKQKYEGLPKCSHIYLRSDSVTIMFMTEVEVKKPKKKPVKKAKKVR